MQNYTFNNLLLDSRDGSVNWIHVDSAVCTIIQHHYVSEDICGLIKGRLASGVLTMALNTLTLLHTLSLNGGQVLLDAMAASKVMKYLERALNKPTIPGLDVAVAQLLLDWTYLLGHTELGQKSYTFINTKAHQRLASLLRPSYVVVLVKQDKQQGLPSLEPTHHGLDFGRVFADPLAGVLASTGPAMGNASPVLAALTARQLSRALTTGPNTGPAPYNADPGRDWLWKGRTGAATPSAAAEQVLQHRAALLAEAGSLVRAKQQVMELAAQQGQASKAALQRLTPRMDAAYTAASNCVQVRDQIQALLQESLSEALTGQLLQLVDEVNKALEGWQGAAAGSLYTILGIRIQAPAPPAPATGALPAPGSPQQQQQRPPAPPGQQAQQVPVAAPLQGTTAAAAGVCMLRAASGPSAPPLPSTSGRTGSSGAVDLLTGQDAGPAAHRGSFSDLAAAAGSYTWPAPAPAAAPPAAAAAAAVRGLPGSSLPVMGPSNPFANPAAAAGSHASMAAAHGMYQHHTAAPRVPSAPTALQSYESVGSSRSGAGAVGLVPAGSAPADDSSGDEREAQLVNPLAQLPAATLARLSAAGAAPATEQAASSLAGLQVGSSGGAAADHGSATSSSSNQLLQQAHSLYKHVQDSCRAKGHGCPHCHAPSALQLVPAVHGLLMQLQQQHDQMLRELQERHQQEVNLLKATAVKKLKEVMLQQQQQQHLS